jgi:acetaldehyde dehydrogenase / alcohol dehydrogenase
MVRAAYSSGKPALGAGPGNAPVYVAADADIDRAAESIVASKTYDNGLICGAEHNLVVHASVHARLTAALEGQGAAVLSAREVAGLSAGRLQLDGGRLDPRMVGQAASDIAARLGIERPYPIRLIVVPAAPELLARGSPLMREKLMPVLSLMTVHDDDEALAVCRKILDLEGLGHTAIVHTGSKALAERFGEEMPASRILVNSPGVQGISGVTTGLVPSFTLGCGTFGGNSTTDNVSFTNLLNIKRLAYALDGPFPR